MAFDSRVLSSAELVATPTHRRILNYGKKIWHFAHERTHEMPITGGASTHRKSIVPSPDALAFTERLLSALHWHGVAVAEFSRIRTGNFELMEINPRLWSSVALAISAGVDFSRGLLALTRCESLALIRNTGLAIIVALFPKTSSAVW